MITRFIFSVTLIISFAQNAAGNDEIQQYVNSESVSLSSFEDFAPFLTDANQKKLVLLGEASHGTSEYYTWRAEISKYLITEKGFDFISVEADWPSAYAVNRYVKNLPGSAETAEEAMEAFVRWPHWMWKNEEVLELIHWLRAHNDELPMEQRVGFYGVDLQNKRKSMDVVLRKLDGTDRSLHRFARNNYNCLLRYDEPIDYLRMVARTREDCSENITEVYERIAANSDLFDEHAFNNIYFNALLVVHAEENLRANLTQGPGSWNVRANHFQYTADWLLKQYGGEDRNANGMVWAHNTHIGDASATDMGPAGMENIGQLAREAYGRENVLAIGFGTYSGEVLAGREWGADKERMQLPESPSGTWEYIAMNTGKDVFAIDFSDAPQLMRTTRIGNRAVGVTYQPENDERNYVPTLMAERYDMFIFFRETTGLSPLGF